MDIKIQDYLSYDEIREIIIEETRNFAKNELDKFKKQEEEENKRIETNLVYEIIGDFVNQEILSNQEYQDEIKKKVKEEIEDEGVVRYEVFYRGYYEEEKSLGYKIIEDTVRENQDIIKEKVKLILENLDYKDLTLKDLLTLYKGD